MIKELWHILTTVANLTKESDRFNREMTGLRQDVDKLHLRVNQLENDLRTSQVTTKLVLENHKNEIDFAKEGIIAKFDVLTSRLDLKIAEFESRQTPYQPNRKNVKSLKKPSHD